MAGWMPTHLQVPRRAVPPACGPARSRAGLCDEQADARSLIAVCHVSRREGASDEEARRTT
eukprot:2145884-Rhodomonas_salina.1